ncbi:MAG: redox-sensing transcriptional repressor Rex [Tissierellia bacterium]|nr:redox-sensing transcriptional repressor Rex [Tissierellia bacterium]
MEKKKKVSETVIRRLPKYHRYLTDLMEEGEDRISSQELSELTGFTASQIRQDLNNFGGFGQQGYGYKVSTLREEIEKILGIDVTYKAIVVGAGNLGSVISHYKGFRDSGFDIVAIFDKNDEVVGTKVGELEVKHVKKLERYLEKHPDITVGILTVPKDGAQEIADRLAAAGIKGIWNFAPLDLSAGEGVIVENVRLVDSLLTLSYYLTDSER